MTAYAEAKQAYRNRTAEQVMACDRAGDVLRWHTNPDMSRAMETVRVHGIDCSFLAMSLWAPNDSPALIYECKYHDYGEGFTGDVPSPAKRKCKELGDLLDRLETQHRAEIGVPRVHLCEEDDARLKFVDKLSAYETARQWAPHVMNRDGWPETRAWLVEQSHKLGVYSALIERLAGECAA